MLHSNIINKYNLLTIKEKKILYLIPAILLINAIYLINSFIYNPNQDSKQIFCNPTLHKIITVKKLKNLNQNMLNIERIEKIDNMIFLDATAPYKNILEFIYKLEQSHITIAKLQILQKNEKTKLSLLISAGAKDE